MKQVRFGRFICLRCLIKSEELDYLACTEYTLCGKCEREQNDQES